MSGAEGNYHGDGSVVLAVVGVTGAAPAALLADGEGGTATGGSTGLLSGTPHSPSVDLIESFCFIEEVAAAIRATKSLDGSMSSSPKRANLRDAPGMQQQHSWEDGETTNPEGDSGVSVKRAAIPMRAGGKGKEEASKVLLRVKQKLQGLEDPNGEALSTEGQVKVLVNEACDPQRLGLLYQGWQAWY